MSINWVFELNRNPEPNLSGFVERIKWASAGRFENRFGLSFLSRLLSKLMYCIDFNGCNGKTFNEH